MTQLAAIPLLKYDYTINTDDGNIIFAVPDLLMKVDIFYDLPSLDQLTAKYVITANETPEHISMSMYGDAKLHWTILFINKITDMGEQWPIPDTLLFSLVENPDAISHYEYKGEVMDLDWIESQYGEDLAIPFTNLDVAVRDNDNRRLIKVIRPEHISMFVTAIMSRLSA